MSVRVIARIRPLLKTEREIDVIVRSESSAVPAQSMQPIPNSGASKRIGAKAGVQTSKGINQKMELDRHNLVRIPNPKNEGEEFSFQFNGVYDASVGQHEIFDAEGKCEMLSVSSLCLE